MARERGFHRRLGGFFVADLADHDHVRVGPQKGAQRLGEGPVDARVHLHLAQAGLSDLDRVLGRPDLAFRHVDVAERRVQRGGLARTRGTHAQHHAVRPLDGVAQTLEVRLRQAEPVERDRLGRRQDPHHHVFQAAVGRNGGHAQLDAVLRRELGEVDLAVLGLAALADVEVAHDLDARDHRVAVVRRQFEVGAQLAVLAKADADLLAARIALDVDVGDAGAMGFQDHPVDHAHQRVVGLLDRRVVVGAVLLAFLLERLEQFAGVVRRELDGLQRHAARAAVGRRADLVVGGEHHAFHVAALREHRHDLHLGDELDLVDRAAAVGRVVERRDQAAVAHQQRHHLQALGGAVADLAQRLGFRREGVQVDQRVAHLAGQRVTMPREVRASPMRAMGMRLWASMARSSCSGMTTSVGVMGASPVLNA
jgi:hypothetical protein